MYRPKYRDADITKARLSRHERAVLIIRNTNSPQRAQHAALHNRKRITRQTAGKIAIAQNSTFDRKLLRYLTFDVLQSRITGAASDLI